MAGKRTSNTNATTRLCNSSSSGIRKCPIPKKHANFLRALLYLEGKQRIALLNSVNRDFIKCICECALNILKGNVVLKPSEKNRLKKHVRLRRLLVYKRKNNNKKKKLNKEKTSLRVKKSYLYSTDVVVFYPLFWHQ